jgi:hypothetical protein
MRKRWALLVLLLVAGLVPIALFGSPLWRTPLPAAPDVVPTPAPAAPPSRPRLAHSTTSVSPFDGGPVPNAEEPPPPAASSDTTTPPEEPAGYLASAGAALKSVVTAVIGAPEPVPSPEPSRQPEPLTGFGSSAPAGAVASAAPGTASEVPALVQFIGLTQDQQLLERNDFEAQVLREVKINVWWNVGGTHTQRLELFAPDGSLYRRLSVSFDANALPRTQGRVLVQTLLPVGGTWITEYSLFGAWRVDVYLGSQSTPVTTASFVLNP